MKAVPQRVVLPYPALAPLRAKDGNDMGTQLLPKQRAEARTKGWLAVGGWALAGLFIFKWWLFGAFLAIAGAGFLTWRWFSFRAKWGMRF